jgi:endonuclease III related protein
MRQEAQIRAHYSTLFRALGPQNWWPARTRFEVIVGAYLTQNTSWTNVERALRRLRSAGLLSIHSIRAASLKRLESAIRPAGYFRQKAQRLKTFAAFLDEFYAGSLARMFAQPTKKVRQELLELNGVGPETADSILLYAGQHPIFVVDAYTRRICERHGILPENTPYEVVRQLWEGALAGISDAEAGSRSDFGRLRSGPSLTVHRPSPMSLATRSHTAQVYNEMHGLIVQIGKHYCLKSKSICEQCPLQPFLPIEKPAMASGAGGRLLPDKAPSVLASHQ